MSITTDVTGAFLIILSSLFVNYVCQYLF